MKTEFNILVIGDVMIDQYMKGVVKRRSPEADIPVLEEVRTISEPGGAANVAMNASLLGSKVTLVGVTGEDQGAKKLRKILSEKSIRAEFITDTTRPTTVKTRVFNGPNQVVRVDEESTDDCSSYITKLLEARIKEVISKEKYDIAILQDYNKGVFHKENISNIVQILKSNGIFIAVDPKKKNFNYFSGVDLFKPNLSEMLHWMGRSTSDKFDLHEVKKLAKALYDEIACTTLLVTLSEHGALLLQGDTSVYKKSIPLDVVDVCGAGDAVITVGSMAKFQNLTNEIILEYCVKTGRIVCEKVGVNGITSAELHRNFI